MIQCYILLQVVYGIPVEKFCVFSVNNSAAFFSTMPRTEEALHYHHWKGQFSIYFVMEADLVAWCTRFLSMELGGFFFIQESCWRNKKIMMTNSIPDPHHHFYVPFHNLTLGIMVPSDEDLSQGNVLDRITKLPTF